MNYKLSPEVIATASRGMLTRMPFLLAPNEALLDLSSLILTKVNKDWGEGKFFQHSLYNFMLFYQKQAKYYSFLSNLICFGNYQTYLTAFLIYQNCKVSGSRINAQPS